MDRRKLDLETLNRYAHNRNMGYIIGGIFVFLVFAGFGLAEIGKIPLMFSVLRGILAAGAVLIVLAINKNGRYKKFAISYMICEGKRETEIGGADSMPETVYQVSAEGKWYNASTRVFRACSSGDILIVVFLGRERTPICIELLKNCTLADELKAYVVSGGEMADKWERDLIAAINNNKRDSQYIHETEKIEEKYKAGKIDDRERERRLKMAENRKKYYFELEDIKEKLTNGVISEEEYKEKFDHYMKTDEE